MKKRAAAKPARRKKLVYPQGWNEKRVQEVIAHYDSQSDEEGAAEYEAAMKIEDLTVMFVPSELVPEIRELIGRRRGA